MASVLDIGLIDYFAPAFTFFLVLLIVWAVLEKTKIFGKSSGINWVIALCMAVLVLLVPGLTDVITIVTPWMVALFIFLTLLILIFMFMGVKGGTVADVFGKNQFVIWIVIFACLGIVGFAMTQVYGDAINQLTSPEDEGDLNQNIGKILFHPKVMGMVIVLIIAAAIVRFVSVSR